ncbi:glycosyltransferase family 4 protein [Moraxella osloensis]|nr:glycosyltransferase family 4 protein [Moraxella osloensis]
MNIALFSRVLFLSGVTTHLIDLSNELIKKGHNVYIFTAGAQNPNNEANVRLADRLEATGAKIIKINFPLTSTNKTSYLVSMLRSVAVVAKELKKNNIDVIHIHTPALSFIPIILRRKFVKTVHIKDLALSFLDKKASHEIVISRETYDEAIRKFHYKENEITLIFNGVAESFAKTISNNDKNNFKETKNIPKDKIIIGIVGSVQYRKGHDILLEAVSQLRNDLKNKVHLIILGEGSETEEIWLKDLIKKFNLESTISKFGFQDPKSYYDIMDIFVLPSRLEGFPLVAIEAMLSNCCVIRSDTEGAYDQIEPGVSGLLFKNESIAELTKQLEFAINNEPERIKIAAAGREYALDNFTAEKMTEKTIAVYEKISQGY